MPRRKKRPAKPVRTMTEYGRDLREETERRLDQSKVETLPPAPVVERVAPVPESHHVITGSDGVPIVTLKPDLDRGEPPQEPSPPIDGDPMLEELKAKGIELSWVPPAVLFKGRLVANLPRGAWREPKGYEVMELIRVVNDRGDNAVLTADEVRQLLGWKEVMR